MADVTSAVRSLLPSAALLRPACVLLCSANGSKPNRWPLCSRWFSFLRPKPQTLNTKDKDI